MLLYFSHCSSSWSFTGSDLKQYFSICSSLLYLAILTKSNNKPWGHSIDCFLLSVRNKPTVVSSDMYHHSLISFNSKAKEIEDRILCLYCSNWIHLCKSAFVRYVSSQLPAWNLKWIHLCKSVLHHIYVSSQLLAWNALVRTPFR